MSTASNIFGTGEFDAQQKKPPKHWMDKMSRGDRRTAVGDWDYPEYNLPTPKAEAARRPKAKPKVAGAAPPLPKNKARVNVVAGGRQRSTARATGRSQLVKGR